MDKSYSHSSSSDTKNKNMSGETLPNRDDGNTAATPLPVSIHTNEPQLSIASTITVDPPSTPPPTFPASPTLNLTNLGIPPTPPSLVMNIVSDKLFEEGYDSDGQMGPFYEHGVSDEKFVTMTEDEPFREIEVMPAPKMETPASAEPVLTDEIIETMKFRDLIDALSKRGVNKSGLKGELVRKLKEAVATGVPMMENRPAEVINNTDGDTFDPGAYWEELRTVGDAIYESIMNVEGGNFRSPTVPAHEHNARLEVIPPRKNYDVQFDRPPFIKSVLLPELNASVNLKKNSNVENCYKEALVTTTVPNM